MALTKVIGAGLGSVSSADLDGAVTINESSADKDFRVESNGQANMLFVDGGNDIVSIVGGGSHTVGSFANTLQIEGTTGSTSSMSITRNTAGTSPPYIQFGKTRGTSVGSNTIVQSGDDLGIITWSGADGTNRDTNGAMIRVAVDGTPGENDMPSRMMFSTTADGASTTTERMRIHNGGVVSIPQGIALGVGTANTASNVLDDYEEGTFTPTLALSGATLASTGGTGRYTKIGRHVYVEGKVSRNTADGGASSTIYIESLPFTSLTADSINVMGSGTIWVDEGGPSTNQGDTVGHAYVPANTARAEIVRGTSSGAETSSRYGIGSEFTNGRHLYFNFVYTTA
jgi:prepilin-type processing-associated H-X9-DG protein